MLIIMIILCSYLFSCVKLSKFVNLQMFQFGYFAQVNSDIGIREERKIKQCRGGWTPDDIYGKFILFIVAHIFYVMLIRLHFRNPQTFPTCHSPVFLRQH